MTNVSNMNKQQKTRVPQKSLETIMTEYNKKILNEILYARVSKQMKSKGQGKLDLDHATKSVSSDTVNNFKNLQHTIQTNPRIIEYDELYQKLTIQKNLPKSTFWGEIIRAPLEVWALGVEFPGFACRSINGNVASLLCFYKINIGKNAE